MRYLALLIVSLTCLSCTSTRTPVPVGPSASAPRGAVISRVVGRRDVIVVRAGPRGPTYSLESKDGTTLAPDMTLQELALNNPEMFQAVRTMQANVLWAGQ